MLSIVLLYTIISIYILIYINTNTRIYIFSEYLSEYTVVFYSIQREEGTCT
jgi:hypothetical protein